MDEFTRKWIRFRKVESIHRRKKDLLYESGNLNNLTWYGSKIGNGKKDYFDYVDVVINFIEQRFDTLSKIINNYSKDLIIYNECIKTWETNCQKFM